MGLLWGLFASHVKMNQIGVIYIQNAADIVAPLRYRTEEGCSMSLFLVRAYDGDRLHNVAAPSSMQKLFYNVKSANF